MIIIHGIFPVKPEAHEDALELMRQMAKASRKEEGCISYEFFVGLTDPNVLLLFQEWESAEALQGHYETRHMAAFLKRLPRVLNGDVATRRYEVRLADEDDEDDEGKPPQRRRLAERQKIIH